MIALLAAPAAARAAPPWKQERPANAEGRDAYDHERYDDAAKHFESLEDELDGEDKAKAAFNRGDTLYKSGDFEGAERAFDQAAAGAGGKTRADAFFNQGLSREAKKDTGGAIQSYRQALLAEPDHEGARMNLERLLRMPPPPPQPKGGKGENKEGKDKQKQQPQGGDQDKQGKKQDQAKGEQPKEAPPKDNSDRKPDSGKLSEKEADDILRSAEQDKTGQRLLQTGKPPPDYNPEKDW